MPDDEPLDDARAVGVAAAAATAKVVETAARAAADRQDRGLRQVRHDPPAERRLDELAAAERWAASQNPDRLHHYYAERDGALSLAQVDVDRLRRSESSLVDDWRHAVGPRDSDTRDGEVRDNGTRETSAGETKSAAPAYDSPERRTGADSALKAAGVTDEPRKARVTSDLLNGADPATAATAGKSTKAATKASTTRAPEQTRIR